MERPFRFIEYKTTHRDEFEVTAGRQPTFALFYLKEGRFRLEIGGEEAVIGAGDLVVLADDVDFTRSVIEPVSFVYVKFCMNPKCPFTLPLPSGRIAFGDKARFLANIALYEALTEAEEPRAIYCREHALEDILLQISAEYAKTEAGKREAGEAYHDPLVSDAVQYVKTHISEKISLQAMCHALSTNPSTLNFRVRRALGRSVGEVIVAERMRVARRLLANTTFAVSQIAVQCGYENIYYFSTAFRKSEGISPSAYRKLYRG